MNPSNIATAPRKTLSGGIALMAIALLTSCATTKSPKAVTQSPTHSASVPADLALVGEWVIAIEPTADVLARAQLVPKQSFTVKAGVTSPVTNVVTTPFDQKKYEESKTTWIEGLNQPGLQQWRIVLKSDQTGLEIAPDSNSNQPLTNSIQWDCHGSQVLHLEYLEKKRFNNYHCRVVSSNEWHYPMEPLGGWFVMRRK